MPYGTTGNDEARHSKFFLIFYDEIFNIFTSMYILNAITKHILRYLVQLEETQTGQFAHCALKKVISIFYRNLQLLCIIR